MPYITVPESPLAERENVRIHYREYGSGNVPLIFLHGGWGYEVYPFVKQVEAFGDRFRIVIPDRSGYGKSERLEAMGTDFHRRAATETKNFLDALGINRAILWGHSDGSVISIHMALAEPERFYGIILEAFHYYRDKPGSHDFFDAMMNDPAMLGERVVSVLAATHGADYWDKLIRLNGIAWLRIAEEARNPKHDLYDGRLSELKTPAIFIHGSRDPRTEADELAMVRKELPDVPVRLIEGGGHSPHSESAAAPESIRLAGEFFDAVLPR